jgi:hypothetical protein
MRDVNRSALVVIPKQPFLDWLRFADPDDPPDTDTLTLEDLRTEPTIYLIPECADEDALQKYLQRHCVEIFEEELNSWLTDDTIWPFDRGYDTFCRWFAVSFHSIVLDLGRNRLTSAQSPQRHEPEYSH